MKKLIKVVSVIFALGSGLTILGLFLNYGETSIKIFMAYPIGLRAITVVSVFINIGILISSFLLFLFKEVGRKLILALSILYLINYVFGIEYLYLLDPVSTIEHIVNIIIPSICILLFTRKSIKGVFS